MASIVLADGIQFLNGLEANRASIIPDVGEPLWTTDTEKFYVGDGATAGGILIGPTAVLGSFLSQDGSNNITGTILPDADYAHNFGSAARRFTLLYANQILDQGGSLEFDISGATNLRGLNAINLTVGAGDIELVITDTLITASASYTPTQAKSLVTMDYVDAADAAVSATIPTNYLRNDANDTTTGNITISTASHAQLLLQATTGVAQVLLRDLDSTGTNNTVYLQASNGGLNISQRVGGTLTRSSLSLFDDGRWTIDAGNLGLVMLPATGGHQGAGTGNFAGVFKNGVEINPAVAPPTAGVLAQAQGLTVRRATTTTVNVQADKLVMTDVNGIGSVITNLNSVSPDLGGAGANTWNEVWVVSSDLVGFNVLVQSEGAGRPAFTYAALVSVLRANASAQLPALIQVGNTVYSSDANNVLFTTATVGTPTLIDMSNAVPLAAQEVIYHTDANRTGAGTTISFQLQPQAGADAGYFQTIQAAASASTQRDLRRDRMHFVEPQKMYYTRASGAWSLSITVQGYVL